MSQFKQISIPTFTDDRGNLSVIDNVLPFEVKRIFYITNASLERGGHRHKVTRQAMICLNGSLDVYMNNGRVEETIKLDSPSKCLLIEPQDWHIMKNFSPDCTLLVLASSHYDVNDYIDELY